VSVPLSTPMSLALSLLQLLFMSDLRDSDLAANRGEGEIEGSGRCGGLHSSAF